jgi:hypothetical protein
MKNGIGKAHSSIKVKKNPYRVLVKKSQEKGLPKSVSGSINGPEPTYCSSSSSKGVLVTATHANRYRRGMDQ